MRACPLLARYARALPGGGAEAGEEVGRGDQEDQGCQPLLVVVSGGLFPDRIGDRVRLIGYTGDGLGEREGGVFGLGKAGSMPPGGHSEDPLVSFARRLENASVLLDAEAATIDLAHAQLHQVNRPPGHDALLFHRLPHGL